MPLTHIELSILTSSVDGALTLMSKRAMFGSPRRLVKGADLSDVAKPVGDTVSSGWNQYVQPHVNSVVNSAASDAISNAWNKYPALQHALYGAAAGGLLGLGSGLLGRKKKSRAFGDALMGALMGGVGVGGLSHLIQQYKSTPEATPVADKPGPVANTAASLGGLLGGLSDPKQFAKDRLEALQEGRIQPTDPGLRGAVQGAGAVGAARLGGGLFESLRNKMQGVSPDQALYRQLAKKPGDNKELLNNIAGAMKVPEAPPAPFAPVAQQVNHLAPMASVVPTATPIDPRSPSSHWSASSQAGSMAPMAEKVEPHFPSPVQPPHGIPVPPVAKPKAPNFDKVMEQNPGWHDLLRAKTPGKMWPRVRDYTLGAGLGAAAGWLNNQAPFDPFINKFTGTQP